MPTCGGTRGSPGRPGRRSATSTATTGGASVLVSRALSAAGRRSTRRRGEPGLPVPPACARAGAGHGSARETDRACSGIPSTARSRITITKSRSAVSRSRSRTRSRRSPGGRVARRSGWSRPWLLQPRWWDHTYLARGSTPSSSSVVRRLSRASSCSSCRATTSPVAGRDLRRVLGSSGSAARARVRTRVVYEQRTRRCGRDPAAARGVFRGAEPAALRAARP